MPSLLAMVKVELPLLWQIAYEAKAELSAQRKCQGGKCVRELPVRPSHSAQLGGGKVSGMEEDCKEAVAQVVLPL